MADHLDKHTDIDEELLALAKELSSLGDIDVPGVSRERTWAKVRSPIHSGEAAAQSGLLGWLRSGRYRWALAPVAAALVAALSLVAVESRGEQPQVAESTSTSTHDTTVLPGGGVVTPTSPTSSGTTSTTKATATTKAAGGGSASTASSTTRTTARSSGRPTTLRPPSGGSATTARPPSTNPSPGTTGSPTTEPQTTTTEPTTTTLEQAVLDAQRESSARAAVMKVARKVLADDVDGAAGLVSGDAQAGLAILATALKNPQRYDILDYGARGDTATLLVEFIDSIPDGSGGLTEVGKRFTFRVRVDGDGATVIGIYRG
jgi:hypothetical protein